MKIPGRKALLVKVEPREYAALLRAARSHTTTMTTILRDLVRKKIMKEQSGIGLLANLKVAKDIAVKNIKSPKEKKKTLVIHFSESEYSAIDKKSAREGVPKSAIIRDIIRQEVMNLS